MRTLSVAEVAGLLGVREARVREILRAGLLRPAGRGRRYAVSFQDLVVLRAAKELLDARVPAARIRRALAALARDLPPGRPLSGVRIQADGRRVVVCDADGVWQPETGQTLFAFDVDALARAAAAVRPAPDESRAGRAAEAQAAFERALDLDDADPKAARAAYERALALDPDLTDARVNLGRLLHEAGDAPAAVRLYREALAQTPDDPIVHFNLALALEDTEGAAAAAVEYERALALDPEFADAHYNLAGLCEQLGRKADAIRHYRAYRDLSEA
jgi:tetratricopeptide (TPR) repeat protein